ncbi:hypothetical protein RJ641_012035 [Dillenia turbinata]|uniref:Uncharacterized protein n=1 Tax=Dillenia turbinata TaxID=194707 RepID=A0AAN8Z5N8_9MAGN
MYLLISSEKELNLACSPTKDFFVLHLSSLFSYLSFLAILISSLCSFSFTDCFQTSRAAGDSGSAVSYFEESIEFLLKLPSDDLEITHTLSVSLNKIGDLKYYGGDMQAARIYYYRSLDVRRNAIKHNSGITSQINCWLIIATGRSKIFFLSIVQILDVAVSLAKVADVDRGLGNEKEAIDGFQEAIQLLESLTLSSEETGLEQRIFLIYPFQFTRDARDPFSTIVCAIGSELVTMKISAKLVHSELTNSVNLHVSTPHEKDRLDGNTYGSHMRLVCEASSQAPFSSPSLSLSSLLRTNELPVDGTSAKAFA